MPNPNLKKFGEFLKELRIKQDLSLRDICKKVSYDPSNWSKIERGLISPPSDEAILKNWAEALGLKNKAYYEFVDLANIAQGIIPDYIMQEKDLVRALPSLFSVLRQGRSSGVELNKLIKLLLKY